MARVLAYTSPGRGHLFPVVSILDELRSRGHEIFLRTLAREVEQMRSRGFDSEAIDPAIEAIEHDDYLARTPQGALKRALRTFARRAERDAPDLRAAADAVEPDLILVDINAWGACAVAQASGRAWAAWLPFPMPHDSPEVPPFGPGLAPAKGRAGRVRDRVLRPLLISSYARALLPAVNGVRERIGVPTLTDPTEMFETPPLLIYTTAEPFEYPRASWPENVLLIGPCAWEPHAEPPAWLREIDRPIVLVTTSSEFQDDGRLIQTALEALADEPVAVVATVPVGQPSGFSPAQRPGGAVHPTPPDPRAGRVRGHTCRHGCHTESARLRGSRVRRAVRPRPARGRPTRRGSSRRYPPTGAPPEPRAATPKDQRRDAMHSRRATDRRTIRGRRRPCARSRRPGATAGHTDPNHGREGATCRALNTSCAAGSALAAHATSTREKTCTARMLSTGDPIGAPTGSARSSPTWKRSRKRSATRRPQAPGGGPPRAEPRFPRVASGACRARPTGSDGARRRSRAAAMKPGPLRPVLAAAALPASNPPARQGSWPALNDKENPMSTAMWLSQEERVQESRRSSGVVHHGLRMVEFHRWQARDENADRPVACGLLICPGGRVKMVAV